MTYDVTTIPTDWHWLDVALGVALLVVALNAARRGFVREAGTLAGLAAGIAVSARLALPLADLLAERVGRLPLLEELSRLLIVVMVAAAANLLAGLLRASLRLPGIAVTDRVGGLALGIAEGAAGLGLLLVLATRLGVLEGGAAGIDGSALAPLLLRWWLAVSAALPPALLGS